MLFFNPYTKKESAMKSLNSPRPGNFFDDGRENAADVDAGICFRDGAEIAVDDDDSATIVGDINLEVSDSSRPWDKVVSSFFRSNKRILGHDNREFIDDVPTPQAAERFAKENKEREGMIPQPFCYGDYLLQKKQRKNNRGYRRMVNNLFREMDRVTSSPNPKNVRHLDCTFA